MFLLHCAELTFTSAFGGALCQPCTGVGLFLEHMHIRASLSLHYEPASPRASVVTESSFRPFSIKSESHAISHFPPFPLNFPIIP